MMMSVPSQSTLPPLYQRRDQILCNRLRIGHTRLTHSHLIDHIDPPECNDCQTHINIITSYNVTRQQCCSDAIVQDIFSLSSDKDVIKFNEKIKLCDKL